ncbi:Hsp33 family molecular chaperone HslO [Pontixanthobacter sp.]|uniref:Hsp33 family molecular chaperone HslO n=1 Tax=Pontixanthobacter sp. TaxID=2792078 RepID=UPI003C7A7B35
MSQQSEIFTDQILNFTLPARDARGRAVRLDCVLNTVLSAHDYPAPIRHLLAEALVLAALIGGLLKDAGAQMTMQAQTQDGVVKLLACDYRAGEVRGYVDFDTERLAGLGSNPSLFALFGQGYLAITFDGVGGGERYQGIVPLEGESLANACENYFVQSEQVPTLIRLGVRNDPDGCVAGGILIQHLPDGEDGRDRLHARLDHPHWEHVSIMGGTIRHDELLDEELSLEAIIWRLFHEEDSIKVEPGAHVIRGCRCSIAHYQSVLNTFPPQELNEMRDDDGVIKVDCAFCSQVFPIAI